MKDYVVIGEKGGYSASEMLSRYTYIVSAENKTEAKRTIREAFDLINLSARLVSDYTQINPYAEFERYYG